MLLGLLLSCAPDDGCQALCVNAKAQFESCLAERDADWGASVGFTSAQDFDDWCDTFIWEERVLGQADQCAVRDALISDGDCTAWYTAWGDL